MSEPIVRPHWPRCAMAQPERSEADWNLTDQARVGHPRVIWWWGTKLGRGKFGAYCYICEDHIATWDSRFPMTGKAKRQVGQHRDWHLLQAERG